MTKLTVAILMISMMAAACGGDGTQVSAAGGPPSSSAAAPVPAPAAPEAAAAAEPAPVPQRPAAQARSRVVARPAPARAERAEASPAPAAAAPAVPEYREFTLPAGTTLTVELKSAVASDVSQLEDIVRGTLRQAVRIDGHEVLPAGTELAGSVIGAERAGRVKGRAWVALQFTSLRYDGERLVMRTEPIEQVAEATKGEDATKIGVGAGAGALIGGLLGGKDGALKGAAIGGAAGTGAVMATRGKEVRLEPGTQLPAKLTAPLAVRVRLQ